MKIRNRQSKYGYILGRFKTSTNICTYYCTWGWSRNYTDAKVFLNFNEINSMINNRKSKKNTIFFISKCIHEQRGYYKRLAPGNLTKMNSLQVLDYLINK